MISDSKPKSEWSATWSKDVPSEPSPIVFTKLGLEYLAELESNRRKNLKKGKG